jgi:molybdopterin-guanine dinucleotide biosynthesis protein A
MNDRIELGREALKYSIEKIERAYFDTVYRATKAILEPVVAATSDVIKESVTEAIKEGVREAFTPTEFLGDLIFGRARKR